MGKKRLAEMQEATKQFAVGHSGSRWPREGHWLSCKVAGACRMPAWQGAGRASLLQADVMLGG